MAEVKSFTSIEQSNVLAKILPLESADMFWWEAEGKEYIYIGKCTDNNSIPAWSLAALLKVLPKLPMVEYDLVVNIEGCYLAFDDCSEKNIHEDFDGATPVDAVFNAIIWLKENNYIDK